MAANDRPSTSSSPPPSPGPSSSASGDQPDGQSRNGEKRKREDTDRPQDSKRSRVTADETIQRCTQDCSYCNMNRLVAHGQYREALAYTRTNVSSVSSKADLQRHLQQVMIFKFRSTDRGRIGCRVLRLDFADIMMYLLTERLEDYNMDDEATFREFFFEYLNPESSETLLKLVDKYTTNIEDKRRVWRIMFHVVEHSIWDSLRLIWNLITRANHPEGLQEYQNFLAHFAQMLLPRATLHDISATASTIGDYTPIFARAVELGLVPEAKLLYEAGAVNNAELTAVANNPGVQQILGDEEDQSKMTVFLRKVLKQPRRLQSMALLQVSCLVGQEDFLGREDKVRQLPLPSSLRDTVLLRPLVNRYRKEIQERID